ncbi:phosphoglycolate phosphatase [Paraneptunicella aestuarii]|uniref:phosphoglycolate phosphatase n=1 Tax=Paraneptunicella aestuarii TaxID=2831148 RepID=UPI001E493A31|nr:phosphoglycolate phosphatase [Paraneptunicella aestuarii]UAA40345.1 phosphoglycolate phosphatase [Paraneptunicella aestuarii]
MSIRAVLFDLDGTLLDTAKDLGNALNHVLEYHGLPICTLEQYRSTASHGSKRMLELGFGERFSEFDFEQLKTQFLDHYENNICRDTELFPGTEEMLMSLNELGISWGIVTNKPAYLTERLLPYFNAFNQCKVVVSGDTLEKAKPHPEPLLHAAQHIDEEPQYIVYVGDAERDIIAAKAANMKSVLANYGYISEHDKPEQWQADIHIDHALELLAHLRS